MGLLKHHVVELAEGARALVHSRFAQGCEERTSDRQTDDSQLIRYTRPESEAQRRKIKLQILLTAEAIKILEKDPERTNAILHLTC